MSVPRYWREIKYHYRLIGSECPRCYRRFYPPKIVCPICGFKGLREVSLPRRGRVLSYTIIRVPPKGFEKYAPYPVAIIELEDGTRVIAQLTDVKSFDDIKIGMEVEAVFRKYREVGHEGIIEYGIKFRPLLKRS